MTLSQDLFYTYKTGKLTVVGFDGKHLAGDQRDRCRDLLLQLVEHHECEYLVVDLTDVPVVSSWILGILAAIRSSGVHVELYHPSAGMRDILETTHLDNLLHIREKK